MAKTKIKELLPDEIKTESENLPIIEETSLHHIVLRVRDWQETIDKKFGREKAYLEFDNEEVNSYKKELLEKGEVDENLNPVDRFYEGVEYEMKRFQLVKNTNGDWLDLSQFCQSTEKPDKETKEIVKSFEIRNCCWVLWDLSIDFERKQNKYEYFIRKSNLSNLIEKSDEKILNIVYGFNFSLNTVILGFVDSFLTKQNNLLKTSFENTFKNKFPSVKFNNISVLYESSFEFIDTTLRIENSNFKQFFNLRSDYKSIIITNSHFFDKAIISLNCCDKLDVQYCHFYKQFTFLPNSFSHEIKHKDNTHDSIDQIYDFKNNNFHNEVNVLFTFVLQAKLRFYNPDSEFFERSKIYRLFDNSTLTINLFNIKTITENAEIYFNNANFTNLISVGENFLHKETKTGRSNLSYLESLRTPSGKSVLVKGVLNQYQKYSHTQHFPSDKRVASFMKDFGVAFETWARIEKNEDVFVSVQATSDGYNVTFESNSEFAINNIERYKQDFQDTISDKNKLNELKQKADVDDFNEIITN